MSHRFRLGSFPKKEREKYLNKTHEELSKEFGDSDGWFNHADPDELKELEYIPYFNQYEEDSWTQFYSFNLKEYGYELYILEKEDLLKIIDIISIQVSEYYEDLYKNFENEDTQGRIASMVMSKKNDWTREFRMKSSLILDENKICSTQSGSYEYMVFNLIAILKMFDWENDYLVFNGW